MSINRVVLVGNLTREPELRYTPQGVAVASMGIAVNRITKNEQGDYEVDFFNIVAWRRTAEFAQNYLHKGSRVAVDGRLQTRSWVDQASGQKRSAVEIVADNLQSLDRRSDGDGYAGDAGRDTNEGVDAGGSAPARAAQPARQYSNTPAAGQKAVRAGSPSDDLDESDPFADE